MKSRCDEAVRIVLARPPKPPRTSDLFSSNTLFGEPGIYPVGSPMVPAGGHVPTAEVVATLIAEAAGEESAPAARIRSHDPTLRRVASDPSVRAAAALLTGTAGESLIELLADHPGIQVGRPASPGRVIGPASPGTDARSIVVNERYAAEHPALMMPSLAHALLWSGPGAGQAEEVLLHAIVALLHAQSIARCPALAHVGTELCRRQNSLVITLLNSRRPGDHTVRLYAPDGSGTIPGGSPSMQTPDFASIPFAPGDDPVRSAPAVLATVLTGLTEAEQTPTGRPAVERYDEELVRSFRLSSYRGLTAADRLRVAVAIGVLQRTDVDEIAEMVGVHPSVVIDELDLVEALTCWSD